MTYRIIRTEKAEEQLRSMLFYIADDSGSVDVALHYLEKLEISINKLKDFPEMGVIPRYATLRRQGYRVLLSGRHLIFYKINEARKEVVIHAIIDERREYKNLL